MHIYILYSTNPCSISNSYVVQRRGGEMSFSISANDRFGNNLSVTIDKKNTDICPLCHNMIIPIELGAYLNGKMTSSPTLQIVNRCPNENCGRVFTAVYEGVPQSNNYDNRYYFLRSLEPVYPTTPELPKNIKDISPNFVKIFSQASFAENYNLNDVCGMGYRKALEFLVKDYLNQYAEKLKINEELIKSTSLGQCIDNYIHDPMTKKVAKRATWLGNDETHYYRKWEDKDLEDLKNLLRLTINSIENELLAQQYEDTMPE